ncbi:hypothetical protein PR048_008194, partial [Dryococelus australis]
MHISQNVRDGTIVINQTTYLENLLERCNMSQCNTASTPMEENFDHSMFKRTKSESHEIETRCRRVIGSLMYAMVCSRPDIYSAITDYNHVLSMVFTKNENCKDSIVWFVDSDWAGDRSDRKSVCGFVFNVYGCIVSWVSRKVYHCFIIHPVRIFSIKHGHKDKVFNNIVSIEYVPREEQVSDVLTKPLGRVKFAKFRGILGL